MKAKFINEKFVEKSDPIADMGIGGVSIYEIFSKIRKEAAEKLIRLLKDMFEGKTIRATSMKWSAIGHRWGKYVIEVDEVLTTYSKDGFTSEIRLKDTSSEIYTLASGQKINILS